LIIDNELIKTFFTALAGFLIPAVTAIVTYRRAMAKNRAESDAIKVQHSKELMDAKADYKQKLDDSDNQKAMIQAIIEQGKSARALADNVVKIVASIEENTRATNKLAEKVDDNKKETNRLDKDVDNFAAHLIRAIKTMEDAKGEIEATAGLIDETGKETQQNSTRLADTILDKLNELKQLSKDTLTIINDIDERVKRLETKPEPIPPPPVPVLILAKPDTPAPIPVAVVETKPNDKAETPKEEKPHGS
jgi:chromosome segregation ATPase